MKYIPGSEFINHAPKFGKYFKRGVTYTLKHIKKESDDKIKYIFSTNGDDKEIFFKSVKEADEFLDSF